MSIAIQAGVVIGCCALVGLVLGFATGLCVWPFAKRPDRDWFLNETDRLYSQGQLTHEEWTHVRAKPFFSSSTTKADQRAVARWMSENRQRVTD